MPYLPVEKKYGELKRGKSADDKNLPNDFPSDADFCVPTILYHCTVVGSAACIRITVPVHVYGYYCSSFGLTFTVDPDTNSAPAFKFNEDTEADPEIGLKIIFSFRCRY